MKACKSLESSRKFSDLREHSPVIRDGNVSRQLITIAITRIRAVRPIKDERGACESPSFLLDETNRPTWSAPCGISYAGLPVTLRPYSSDRLSFNIDLLAGASSSQTFSIILYKSARLNVSVCLERPKTLNGKHAIIYVDHFRYLEILLLQILHLQISANTLRI